MYRRSGRVVASCAALGCLAWLLTSCQMPELTRTSITHFPPAQACSECHVEIYDEWKHSPHEAAFVSETYRHATDNYQFRECLGCHAPQPMLAAGEPQARAIDRDLGVTCTTCHLDHGAMVGPNPPTGFARPHPIQVNSVLFEDGTLCGRCHQSTLSQWQAARVRPKPDCRQCHMPEVRRTMTQATTLISRPIVAAEKAALEHRHVFTLIPADLPDEPFDLDIRPHGHDVTVILTNNLPHDLPTGDFGVRIMRISVHSIDSAGKESLLARWEVAGNLGGSLPSGKARQWEATLPPDSRRLKIEMVRRGREAADEILLLRKEVVLP